MESLLIEFDRFLRFDLVGHIASHGINKPFFHVGDGIPLEPACAAVLADIAVPEIFDGAALHELLIDRFGGRCIVRYDHHGRRIVALLHHDGNRLAAHRGGAAAVVAGHQIDAEEAVTCGVRAR